MTEYIIKLDNTKAVVTGVKCMLVAGHRVACTDVSFGDPEQRMPVIFSDIQDAQDTLFQVKRLVGLQMKIVEYTPKTPSVPSN